MEKKFYGMTNDYMFKAVMQECEDVLRNLVGALLNLDEADILECEVTNHRVYTDKFVMKVLNLRNVDNAGDTDERVIHWARIFKAKTLNELEELAGEQEDFKKMVFELKKLTEDEKIKQQMEARADYESRIATARGAGRREGLEEGRLIEIISFVKDGMCTVEVGANRAGMTVAEFEKAMASNKQ